MDCKSNTGSNGSGKQRVKVVVRVRPQLQKEDKTWVHVTDSKTLHTLNHRNPDETLQYEFESVYDASTAQATVYAECVKPLLHKTLHGQNASVFAYGPTGAGKTHTILGTATDPGLIPRCIKGTFTNIDSLNQKLSRLGEHWNFKVQFSYLEIYQEKVIDLLDVKQVDLPIREDQHRNIFVTGLSEKEIKNVKEFNGLFAPASLNRHTAATKLNERSSRSHSILLLKVTRTQTTAPYRKLIGKLYIVDLAGSEDNRRTGNQGIRLKESGAINSSLLALGQVVDALNKNQNCVPYRSSKLTRLLQDSLGGSAHTCMIVNLAPEERHYFDTYTTLHFARKTKKVVNTVRTNETVVQVTRMPESRKRSADQEKTPTKKMKPDPTPFLSPMLRNQEQFKLELKKEMFSRLEELESRILEQMKSTQNESQSLLDVTKATPDSTTDELESSKDQHESGWGDVALGKLDNIMDQLKHFREDEDLSKNMKALKSISTNDKVTESKVYSDGSTALRLPDVTSSPLFAATSIVRKKGFTSTAARKFIDSPVKSSKENTATMNPDLQKSHNDRILHILNTGSLKDLQQLQTVGGKRAQLIHSWRELNTHFTCFEDLRQVHGLTDKYVKNFMKSNLIRL